MKKDFVNIVREAINRNTTAPIIPHNPLLKPLQYFFWPMLNSAYSRSGQTKAFLTANADNQEYFDLIWQNASIENKNCFISEFLLGELSSNINLLYEANLSKTPVKNLDFVKKLHSSIPSYVFDIINDIGNSEEFSTYDYTLNRNLLLIKLYQQTMINEDPCKHIKQLESLISNLELYRKVSDSKLKKVNASEQETSLDNNSEIIVSDDLQVILDRIESDFLSKKERYGNSHFYVNGLEYDYKTNINFWIDINRLLHKKSEAFDSAWDKIERSKGFLDRRKEVVLDNAKYCECLTDKIFSGVREQGFDSLKIDSCYALLSKTNPSEKALFQASVLFSGIKEPKYVSSNLTRIVAKNISSMGPIVMPNLALSADKSVQKILEEYFDGAKK